MRLLALSSLAIGLTCAVLIMLSIRYEMSYDAFRPHADRIYRIMKRDIDARTSRMARRTSLRDCRAFAR